MSFQKYECDHQQGSQERARRTRLNPESGVRWHALTIQFYAETPFFGPVIKEEE